MEKVKFGQFLTVEKEVYKVCPRCRTEIKPEWTHAYNNEWCPSCGLNHQDDDEENTGNDINI